MFKFAQGKGTSGSLYRVPLGFPQGRHVNEAKDSRAFVQAQVQGTWEAYAEYIASYPSGPARRGQRPWMTLRTGPKKSSPSIHSPHRKAGRAGEASCLVDSHVARGDDGPRM